MKLDEIDQKRVKAMQYAVNRRCGPWWLCTIKPDGFAKPNRWLRKMKPGGFVR